MGGPHPDWELGKGQKGRCQAGLTGCQAGNTELNIADADALFGDQLYFSSLPIIFPKRETAMLSSSQVVLQSVKLGMRN